MTDVCQQVAKFLAASTGKVYGEQVFYYAMPDDVNECTVVQRNKSSAHVPVQIDAGYHSLRIACRAPYSDAAYTAADELYEALSGSVDTSIGDTPGFIKLEETYAQATLYDRPMWDSTDQQGRKVFYFDVLLITKR